MGLDTMQATSNFTRKLNVLVVDDERLIADSLAQILNMVGFNASSRYSGPQAIDQAGIDPFDVLISDVVMEEMTGIDAAIEICKVLPNCKVLLISGNHRTGDMLKEAQERGHNFDIVAKPVHPSEIIERIKAMSVVN
jgi:DNA-binding NtrC family response regulator